MAPKADILDLSRVAAAPGDGRRLDVDVVPGRLVYGGQDYEVAGRAATARLDVSRTTTGYALRLRFEADVSGPCVRCLADASVHVAVDAREIEQIGRSGDEHADADLDSPYVSGDELDLAAWAHDALALAMPEQFLCSADCPGLCDECGEPLNQGEHEHGQSRDPRWDKLRELKFE